jgi:diaminobutyrate-2-oxoglutarate transaminase
VGLAIVVAATDQISLPVSALLIFGVGCFDAFSNVPALVYVGRLVEPRLMASALGLSGIQVGCGRTGSFFSFEAAGLKPDLVVLSKAISGYGQPMALLLIRPELDQWKPGEHTGTFRGNNLAFVTAREALRYWETPALGEAVAARGRQLAERLHGLAKDFPELGATVRGLGLIWGLEIADPARCQAVARAAFERGLIIETCGSKKNVLKFIPPLVIDEATLDAGVDLVREAIQHTAAGTPALAAT